MAKTVRSGFYFPGEPTFFKIDCMHYIYALIERWKRFIINRRHQRFLWLFDFPETGSVLDISCGDGDFLETIHSYFPELELSGIDISAAAVEKAKHRCPYADIKVANAELLPYEGGKFTVALSCMTLHHYENPSMIFAEVSRVLASDGTFYIVDLIPKYRLSQILYNWDGCPEPYHFEKYYLESEIELLANAAGLSIQDHKMLSRLSGQSVLTLKRM